jgi:hypothetical protein
MTTGLWVFVDDALIVAQTAIAKIGRLEKGWQHLGVPLHPIEITSYLEIFHDGRFTCSLI